MNCDVYIENHKHVTPLNDVINNVYFSDKYCYPEQISNGP